MRRNRRCRHGSGGGLIPRKDDDLAADTRWCRRRQMHREGLPGIRLGTQFITTRPVGSVLRPLDLGPTSRPERAQAWPTRRRKFAMHVDSLRNAPRRGLPDADVWVWLSLCRANGCTPSRVTGSMLSGLASLATLARYASTNLVILVINNRSFVSTGGHPRRRLPRPASLPSPLVR